MPCHRFFVLSYSGVPRTFVEDCSWGEKVIIEVKRAVYGMQTAKRKLLPSLFSCIYSRVKLVVFIMNSTVGDYYIFKGFI